MLDPDLHLFQAMIIILHMVGDDMKVRKYIWFGCLEEDDESSSRMMLTPRSSSMSLSTSLFLTSHRHCLLDLGIEVF
jgi:hypothetical protein